MLPANTSSPATTRPVCVGGSDFKFDDQMQQVFSHVLLANLIGALLAEVRQFANRPQVSVNRSFRFPGQSQVIDHFPEQFSFEIFSLGG